jgi:ATP/maltotriose-dependent transcriptional regulator MalT
MHIVELQRKLMDNRNLQIQQQRQAAQQQSVSDQQYMRRTAALEKEEEKEKERQKQERERDVVGLLNEGYNTYQASYILEIPLSEVARIEEYNQRKRKFLKTGNLDLPGQMAGISIFQ